MLPIPFPVVPFLYLVFFKSHAKDRAVSFGLQGVAHTAALEPPSLKGAGALSTRIGLFFLRLPVALQTS